MTTSTPTPIKTLDEARKSSRATLSREEVSAILEVDPRTVSEGARNGSIPSVKLGRRVLFPRERFLAMFEVDGQ